MKKKKITKKMKALFAKRYGYLEITQKEAREMDFGDLVFEKLRYFDELKYYYKYCEKRKNIETDNWIIVKKEGRSCLSCHPSVSDFTPDLKFGFDKKRKKKVVIVTIYNDTYTSSKHNHKVITNIAKFEEENILGVPEVKILIEVLLSRYSFGFKFNGEFGALYFCGSEGGGFVTRLPYGTPEKFEIVEEYLKPAFVKKAEQEGRRIFRQGDIFFVEMKKGNIFNYTKDLPFSHKLKQEGESVKVLHSEHPTLILPGFNFKPVLRRQTVSGYE